MKKRASLKIGLRAFCIFAIIYVDKGHLCSEIYRKNMKTMQVFNSYSMPTGIREGFFRHFETVGNDCYVEVYLSDFLSGEFGEECQKIGEWLVSQGATDDEVLVDHSW